MAIYRVEIRADVEAPDDDEARQRAPELRDRLGAGEVTAIFDEAWDELD